jgi:hypothetical protein
MKYKNNYQVSYSSRAIKDQWSSEDHKIQFESQTSKIGYN